MIVVLDTSMLIYVFDDQAKAPVDPTTDKPVTDCQARINHLISTLQRERATIVIPTPTLAEILVGAGSALTEWQNTLHRTRCVKIAPFDERAAIEHALREADRKAARAAGVPRPKAKFDDQIIAIAQTENASVIYSDDPHIRNRAPKGVKVIGIAELELPPEERQGRLHLDPPDPTKPVENAAAETGKAPGLETTNAAVAPEPSDGADAAPEREQENTTPPPAIACQPEKVQAKADGTGEPTAEQDRATDADGTPLQVVTPPPVEPAEDRPAGS